MLVMQWCSVRAVGWLTLVDHAHAACTERCRTDTCLHALVDCLALPGHMLHQRRPVAMHEWEKLRGAVEYSSGACQLVGGVPERPVAAVTRFRTGGHVCETLIGGPGAWPRGSVPTASVIPLG